MDNNQTVDAKIMAKNVAGSGLNAEMLQSLYERMLREQKRYHDEVDYLDREVAEGDDLVPERGGVSNHIADDADEVTEQEKDMALRRNSETLIELVELALGKMQAGSYGRCEVCGKQIGERLEARPYARYCIVDQAKEEARERQQVAANAQSEYLPRVAGSSEE